MTIETEIAREIYAALNRNDIPGIFKHFDPEIERIEPPGFPPPNIMRGTAEVKAHFSKARDTWAEGSCDPEKVIAAGEKVVVLVHVRVRLKGKTEWNEGRLADGFIFRKGKVIYMRTFMEQAEALAWAGVQS